MTTITIERELLEQIVELFDSAITARYPHEILRDIRAALAAPASKPLFAELIAQHEGLAEELAAMDVPPAWHDAPTCDGLWVCNEGDDNPYRWTTHRVKFPISPLLVGEDERWLGPIPQDAKTESGAA